MKRLDRVVLDGRHVHLEPLAREHAGPLHQAASESRRTYGLTLVPDTEVEMLAYIDNLLGEEERGEALPFVVKANGTVVGATRFLTIEWWKWDLFPPVEPLPVGPDAIEIGGTWYAERVQRTALNTEAKLLLCIHAFEALRVRRVTWKTDARNERSRAAILRLGARFEGVLRAHRPAFDGAVRDTAFYSMLSSEWPQAKRALEEKLASRETPG
jgi:RimJ/RimL family protein N-acetyltransferase